MTTPYWREYVATWGDDLRDEYEERAAIIAVDGGAPRDLAEFMAFMRVCRMHVHQRRAHQHQHSSNTCQTEGTT